MRIYVATIRSYIVRYVSIIIGYKATLNNHTALTTITVGSSGLFKVKTVQSLQFSLSPAHT